MTLETDRVITATWSGAMKSISFLFHLISMNPPEIIKTLLNSLHPVFAPLMVANTIDLLVRLTNGHLTGWSFGIMAVSCAFFALLSVHLLIGVSRMARDQSASPSSP